MKFMFGLQHPLTCKPWTTLSNPCNKVRGKYNCKEVFMRLPSCILIVTVCVVYSCVCLWCCVVVMLNDDVDDYITVARVSLTLSRHFSLSFIASGRSSGQYPVSSHSCWMYVRAGRPAFARPCVGVRKSTSLMSSSLRLQQCPACLQSSLSSNEKTICFTW